MAEMLLLGKDVDIFPCFVCGQPVKGKVYVKVEPEFEVGVNEEFKAKVSLKTTLTRLVVEHDCTGASRYGHRLIRYQKGVDVGWFCTGCSWQLHQDVQEEEATRLWQREDARHVS